MLLASRYAWRASPGARGLVGIALATVVGVLVLTRPAVAGAHATLVEMIPAAGATVAEVPGEVTLVFDERVDVAPGGISVFDPIGVRADLGVVDPTEGSTRLRVPVEASREGTYTVAWNVMSDDGHDLAGSFVFNVGEASESAAPVLQRSGWAAVVSDISRGIAQTGSILLLGCTVLRLTLRDEAAAERALRDVCVVSGVAGAAAVVALLVAQTALASGRPVLDAIEITWEVSTSNRTGTAQLLRLGLLLVGVLSSSVSRRPATVAAAGLTVASQVSSVIAGHAWTAPDRVVAVLAASVHVLAVGIWIGGLVGLLVTLDCAADRDRLATGFSRLALGSAIAVGVAGAVSAVEQVGSIPAMTETAYGRLLLVKVVGFVALLAFGWKSRTRLVPVVASVPSRLARVVRMEVVLAAVILATTTAMVGNETGRDAYSPEFAATIGADDVIVQVTVEPARAGANDIHMYFFDADGTTPASVDAVEVRVSTEEIPPRRAEVTFISSGHVVAQQVALTTSASWMVDIVAISDGSPASFELEVPIR